MIKLCVQVFIMYISVCVCVCGLSLYADCRFCAALWTICNMIL